MSPIHQSPGRPQSREAHCPPCPPSLKVHRLSRADADQDSQDFHTGGSLRHRGIKAVTTLFDGREMESRRVGDCLKELRMVHVIVRPGNGRMLPTA